MPAPNPFLEGSGLHRSMNRVVIGAVPRALMGGERGDPIRGLTGYRLLGLRPLRDLVGRVAGAAGSAAPLDPIAALDDWFVSAPPLGDRVADLYARRVAAQLIVLHEGRRTARRARSEWSAQHWAHWAGIRTVFLGGGVMAGRFGAAVVPRAAALISDATGGALTVRLAPNPASLSMVGLARCAPMTGDGRVLVADFGQTHCKTGIVAVRGGQVATLTLRAPMPAPCPRMVEPDPDPVEAAARWETLEELLVSAASGSDPSAVGIALATYLDQGQPIPADNGCYTALRLLSSDLPAFIRERLRSRGLPGALVLLGDGDAAGAALAGEERAAVITFGTALGIGFPEAAEGYAAGDVRGLAPGFVAG